MNCLHVNTVDTGWKESILICQHCQYRFIWYSKCFYSKDELPSCRHCRYKSRMDLKQRYRFIWYSKCFYSKDELSSCLHCLYWMKGIHPNMSTLSIQVHLVFEMFLLKRWTAFMSTLSIHIENGFKANIRVSSSIRNVLLKTESMSTLSIQGCLSRKSSIQHCRYRFIWYSKCFYSKDELPSCRHCRYKSRMDLKQRYMSSCLHCLYWMKRIHPNMSTLSIQVDLVFEMFLLKRWTAFMSTLSIQIDNGFEAKIQVHLVFEMFLLKRWTAFMSTLSILNQRNPSEYVNTVDTGSSGIRNVSTQKMNCLHVDTVNTNREWIRSKDTGSSGIRNVSSHKMNCLQVYTVDTGWKESIRICQHCRYRFIWYSKCFYSKDELPSCWHCRYKSRMDSKQWYEFHPVFEMYYWRQRACRHCWYKVVWVENLQYWMKGIHPNMSTLSIQGCLSRKSSIQHCQYRFIWYSKCFYSKDELPSCRHCRYKSRMDLKQRYRFIWYSKCFYSKDELSSCQHCRYWMKGIHLNMSTLSIQVHLVFEMFLLKRWTAFMSTLSIQIENGFEAMIRVSSSIRNVLLKTESMSTLLIQGCLSRKSSILDERNPSEYVNTVDTRLFE